MLTRVHIRFLVILAVFACSARPAFAQGTLSDDTVNRVPHRIFGEIGVFSLTKGEGSGPAFGLGYAFRALHGLELGVGMRYLLVPAHESPNLVSQPAPLPDGTVPPPSAPYVNPATHMGFAFLSLRGYLALDAADRFELGLTVRGGLLARSGASGICCTELALAPDLRVRVSRGLAMQLAPELAIGTTGNHNGPNTEDYVDEIFGHAAVWLSFVQTL